MAFRDEASVLLIAVMREQGAGRPVIKAITRRFAARFI
jgi:hypothetical protein